MGLGSWSGLRTFAPIIMNSSRFYCNLMRDTYFTVFYIWYSSEIRSVKSLLFSVWKGNRNFCHFNLIECKVFKSRALNSCLNNVFSQSNGQNSIQNQDKVIGFQFGSIISCQLKCQTKEFKEPALHSSARLRQYLNYWIVVSAHLKFTYRYLNIENCVRSSITLSKCT